MDRGIKSGKSEIYRKYPATELRGGDSAEAKKMTKNVANLGRMSENLSRWG